MHRKFQVFSGAPNLITSETPEIKFLFAAEALVSSGATKMQKFGALEAPERSGASGARIYSIFAPEISGAPAPS